jgi:hypothetical protein
VVQVRAKEARNLLFALYPARLGSDYAARVRTVTADRRREYAQRSLADDPDFFGCGRQIDGQLTVAARVGGFFSREDPDRPGNSSPRHRRRSVSVDLLEAEKGRRLKTGTLVLGLWLAAAPALAAVADLSDEDSPLAETLVRSAKSPEDHRALAAYFGAKAAAARQDANAHRQMELSYSHLGLPAQAMVEHCQKLSALDKEMAREYEALARGHAAEAEK